MTKMRLSSLKAILLNPLIVMTILLFILSYALLTTIEKSVEETGVVKEATNFFLDIKETVEETIEERNEAE